MRRNFQQWSKKTEAFFAGVIKESEMMLEWAAEQPTEITMFELWTSNQHLTKVCYSVLVGLLG